MKIYVDELPKSCEECPFHKVETYVDIAGYTINSYECVLDGSILINNCPLQSLADHDKQVRKKMCEEVREAVNECRRKYYNDFLLGLPLQTEKYYRGYDFIQAGKLTKILDQIQGETK